MMVQPIGSTSWPPQSPETTPLNFFLLGFVKDEVYVLPMPKTLNNLKDTYSNCKTEQPLLQSVWYKVKYHLDMCRATNGVYFEFAQGINKTLNCSLQWCVFNLCVAITILPIHFCNQTICHCTVCW